MPTQQTCEWFIEPLDAETNNSVARELPEENSFAKIMCADGRMRNLWQCSFGQLKFFGNSRSAGLDFRVFKRYANGRIKVAVRELPAPVARKILREKKKGAVHA